MKNEKKQNEELLSLEYENSPFKTDGVINRRNFFFTLAYLVGFTNASTALVWIVSKNEIVIALYYLLVIVFDLILYYTTVLKRVTDIRGSKKFIVFWTILYAIPPLTLIPLFKPGKVTPLLNKIEEQTFRNNFWEVTGKITSVSLIFNIVVGVLIIMLAMWLYKYSVNDPYMLETFGVFQMASIIVVGVLVVAYNIHKFIYSSRSGLNR